MQKMGFVLKKEIRINKCISSLFVKIFSFTNKVNQMFLLFHFFTFILSYALINIFVVI